VCWIIPNVCATIPVRRWPRPTTLPGGCCCKLRPWVGRRGQGAIAVNRYADLLALDTIGPDMAGLQGDTALDAWIFAGNDRLTTDLWSAGRNLVTQGRHHAHDAITRAYSATVARLRAQ
jgi:hypothetical protein